MPHEINTREGSGISVSLYWEEENGSTYIELETNEEWHRFTVAPEKAQDAFLHPFVYLARSVDHLTVPAGVSLPGVES